MVLGWTEGHVHEHVHGDVHGDVLLWCENFVEAGFKPKSYIAWLYTMWLA